MIVCQTDLTLSRRSGMGAAGSVVSRDDLQVKNCLTDRYDFTEMDSYLDERLQFGSSQVKKMAGIIKSLKTEVRECYFCNDVGYTYGDRGGATSNLDGRGDHDVYECSHCGSGKLLGPFTFDPGFDARFTKTHSRPRYLLERIATLDFDKTKTALDNNLIPGLSTEIASAIRSDLDRKDSLMSFLLPLIANEHLDDDGKEQLLLQLIAHILMKPGIIVNALKYLKLPGSMELFKFVEGNAERKVRRARCDQTIFSDDVKLMIHVLITKKMPTLLKKELDKATKDFGDSLSELGFGVTKFHLASVWEIFRRGHESQGRYRVMSEMSKLQSFSEAETKSCYRFGVSAPNASMHENESFAFFFVLNESKNREAAIRLMVKTIMFMFSDNKTETILECFEWAKNKGNIKSLSLTQYKWNVDGTLGGIEKVIRPYFLQFVEVKTSAVVQIHNSHFIDYFQEGVLSKFVFDSLESKRWGQIDLESESLVYK